MRPDHVVLRQLFRGRIWNAVPCIEVRRDAESRVLWLPPDVEYAHAEGSLFGEWELRMRRADRGLLRLTRPETAHSLLLFWHDDGAFRGWYVNFERAVPAPAPFADYEDHLLDLFVEADGSHRWLDEDELAEAVDRGIFSERDAAAFRAEGERVLREWPFPTGWEDWRPDPGWEPPRLADGWDVR